MLTHPRHWSYGAWFLAMVAAATSFYVLVQFVGATPEERLLDRIEVARHAWQEAAIADYDLSYTTANYWDWRGVTTVRVRNGVVDQVLWNGDAEPPEHPSLTRYTVEDVFAMLEARSASGPHDFHVDGDTGVPVRALWATDELALDGGGGFFLVSLVNVASGERISP